MQPGADRRSITYGLKGPLVLHRVGDTEKHLFSHTNVELVTLDDPSLDVDRSRWLPQLSPESIGRSAPGSSRKSPPRQVSSINSQAQLSDRGFERDIDKELPTRESSLV
jgi:hypothetical protein